MNNLNFITYRFEHFSFYFSSDNNYQGYPPNNNYRPDNYQGQGNYSSGGFSKFQNNRGGMNSTGTPSSNGYQRGGPGGSSGRGGILSLPSY